jgi:hypothetical protein
MTGGRGAAERVISLAPVRGDDSNRGVEENRSVITVYLPYTRDPD